MKTTTKNKNRIVIQVVDGNVLYVFADNPDIEVIMADFDNLDEGEWNEAKAQKELDDLTCKMAQVY